MDLLTILSPHQDDAALSLGITIRAAARSGRPVRVVTCFTVSEYAPHSAARGVSEIGVLRRAEDREFASRAGAGVEMIDLGMEDAPVRLRCTVAEVRRRSVDRRAREDAARIADALAALGPGVVLAPLGLGRHIDHLVAREAAFRLARAGRAVGFYEDLPYAAELRECCILAAADHAASRFGARLYGWLLRDAEAAARKRFAIEAYHSQLSLAQFDSVIGYCEGRGGERIWGTTALAQSIPSLERGAIGTSSSATARARGFWCAAHAGAARARAVMRRATELISGGGLNAPQTN